MWLMLLLVHLRSRNAVALLTGTSSLLDAVALLVGSSSLTVRLFGLLVLRLLCGEIAFGHVWTLMETAIQIS